MQVDQLRALIAVIDRGTFEGAARELSITPSAVSQRIRALETSAGRVLVRRESPCTTTEAGAVVLRAARQLDLVLQDVTDALTGPGDHRTVLSVAVNADSLATWFHPVLDAVGTWDDALLRLRVEDQEHTRALLARGEVLAAVTTDARPVVGCTVHPLGAMRYLPVATPALLARHQGDAPRGQTHPETHRAPLDLSTVPVVQFNAKDALQDTVLSARQALHAPWHEVPSSEAFARAVLAGLGWGMLPEHQIGAALDDGRLQRLPEAAHQDVRLYWQVWRIGSRHLERLTETVVSAARALRPG